MKQLLETIGAGDGQGSVSHTRLINILVALTWLISKFYNAHLTHLSITWDTSDLEIFGAIGGVSIAKTVAENSKPTTPETPKT